MMYTVFRLDCMNSRISIHELGAYLQMFPFFAYDGPDKGVADRVSCTVATEDAWDDHLSSIERFLGGSSELFEWAKFHGVEMCFDVAIEPDDFNGIVGRFNMPHELLKSIGQTEIDVTISVYR